MAIDPKEADVVVVGSGMGGLVATVRALEHDAEVILLEKGHQLGGTTRITGGYMLVNKDSEPLIDAFEPIEEGIEWLEEHGVNIERSGWQTETSRYKIDPPDFVIHMSELIEEMGGEVLLQTAFEDLMTHDDGSISGLIAYDYDEGQFEISAPCVILATGGRSGNEELLSRYFPDADLWLGRDPWSVGDGFRAAKDIGAKGTAELSTPIAASLPAPPAKITFEELRCFQVYDSSAIIIDDSGKRFGDESRHRIGHYGITQDIITEADGTAFLIIDQDLYENDERYPQWNIGACVEQARDMGAPVIEAESLDELGKQLDEHGVMGRTAIETISEFNEAIYSGTPKELDPPRSQFHEAMDTPPYYAVKIRAAIIYFLGGLDIDHNARVVSRSRSTSSLPYFMSNPNEICVEPITGLYATGIEVGREEEFGYYLGGLSLGLSTGRIAGKHAAKHADKLMIDT